MVTFAEEIFNGKLPSVCSAATYSEDTMNFLKVNISLKWNTQPLQCQGLSNTSHLLLQAFKVGLSPSKKFVFIYFNERPLRILTGTHPQIKLQRLRKLTKKTV